jgi:(p)ppGpp synthase/HD superfamily hydrolase
MLSTRFDQAFLYARQLHQGQTRKGTTIPYISHLMAVAALVVEHGGNEDQAIAGLLHDAAEDQGGVQTLAAIRAKFGDAVAHIVADCTDAWTEPKPLWRPRKEAYLKALPSKPQASLLVSLADKAHNAEAILFDYRVLGDSLWDRFNGGADGTRWYYGALAACFANIMPGRLSDRLSRAVKSFGS